MENVISRFMTSFDTKNWDVMASTLGAELWVDYSDLRHEPPHLTTRSGYVGSRKSAHADTRTHHLISNLDVALEGQSAEVDASCVIFRNNGETSFNSHALYHFRLKKLVDDWLIVAIRQSILWNEGSPAIHKGIAGTDGEVESP